MYFPAMISRRFFGIASTDCQPCTRLNGKPILTCAVCVQAGEGSKKSSGSEEARHDGQSQAPYRGGAAIALQTPPLQQHKERYDNPEGVHASIQSILRETLAARCNPLVYRLVREPPANHSPKKETSGRRDVKEAGRERGCYAEASAQNVSWSCEKRVLRPAEKSTTQVL